MNLFQSLIECGNDDVREDYAGPAANLEFVVGFEWRIAKMRSIAESRPATETNGCTETAGKEWTEHERCKDRGQREKGRRRG